MFVDIYVEKEIHKMRLAGVDFKKWEIMEAVEGLPYGLPETISAFANTHGGTIVLGLSVKNNFRPAKGFDAGMTFAKMQSVGNLLTPAVRMEIETVPFDDAVLVVARVPAVEPALRPCFVTVLGKHEGAFVRNGDGDRRLSPYEIERLAEYRRQPRFDAEVVTEATLDDLDSATVSGIIRKARESFAKVFDKASDETVLLQLGAVGRVGETVRPTVAGLLAAGTFPQKYFPRLGVVFSVFPGPTKELDAVTGRRYLDSKEIIGSVSDILIEVMALVQERMCTGAIVEGGLRRDLPDYQLDAVREAVANALQHRDYSPEGCGTQVQVNLYSDRLEILSPGGLYGATTVESLGRGGLSSTRNEILSRLLSYTPLGSGCVVENKGTGFVNIRQLLAKENMLQPNIQNSLTFFKVLFKKRSTANDGASAGIWKDPNRAIISELSGENGVSVARLVAISGLSRATISKHVRALVDGGVIEPTEPFRSPRQRYRLVR